MIWECEHNMSKTLDPYEQGDLRHREQKEIDDFFNVFGKETDRGLAIASVCYLDSTLEKLIKAAYRKDQRIKILFKDNQILQSFYNKVCIAYFSGLKSQSALKANSRNRKKMLDLDGVHLLSDWDSTVKQFCQDN